VAGGTHRIVGDTPWGNHPSDLTAPEHSMGSSRLPSMLSASATEQRVVLTLIARDVNDSKVGTLLSDERVEVSGRYSNHADLRRNASERFLRFEFSWSPKPETQTLRRSQRRLSPDDLESLLKGYERGTPVNVLANEFGIHRSTVMDHLNRSTARRRYPALDMRGIETASSQLYSTGLSLRDIGRSRGPREHCPISSSKRGSPSA
jgi:hypothetical protein